MAEREMWYEVELPATPAAISTARKAVSKFAASHGADRQKVAVAVSEAVANAVAHAVEQVRLDNSIELSILVAASDEQRTVARWAKPAQKTL